MDEFFCAHLGDMLTKCEKGECSATGFLNPAEQYEAEKFIKASRTLSEVKLDENGGIVSEGGFDDGGYIFWGGYAAAERKRLFTLPTYLFYTAANITELLEGYGEESISAVSFKGSGFVRLSHRDYMGALMNCGIKRESLGDIVTSDENGGQSDKEAVVFMLPSVAKWLTEGGEPIESVGRDRVKLTRARLGDGFSAGREFKRIDGVIASERLDCAVGLLCGLAREKAKTAIVSGIVQLNYETIMSPDRPISEGDIISVRGYGRFRIESFEGKTKKDRLRLAAVKYI